MRLTASAPGTGLEIVDVSHSFKAPAARALSHVSFAVGPGEIVALLGPNGAGKTTLVKIVNGLILPDNGRFFVDGVDGVSNVRRVAERTGTLFDNQRCLYFGLTVKQNVYYFGQLKGASKASISATLREFADQLDLKELLNRRVATLSHGQRQRAGIAAALAHHPRILVLDEPTNGLDVDNTVALGTIIKSLASTGIAILLSSHNLNLVQEVANRVSFIQGGSVIGEYTMSEALQLGAQVYKLKINPGPSARPESIETRYLGCRIVDWSAPHLVIDLRSQVSLDQVIQKLLSSGYDVAAVEHLGADLHDVYREVVRGSAQGGEQR